MTPETLAALQHARATRTPIILATRLTDGAQHLLPNPAAPAALQHAAAEALSANKSSTLTVDGAPWFLHLHAPSPRLLIIGAVHIAQALAPMATLAGLDVTIIDPRRGFATQTRFPATTLLTLWPDEALATLAPDRHTAVVTLSHDPKLDDPALHTALATEAFYIGSLGSRRSHANRLTRLAALGHGQAALSRIRGPVGLAIGALTAPEIAVSTLAEIIAARRNAPLATRGA